MTYSDSSSSKTSYLRRRTSHPTSAPYSSPENTQPSSSASLLNPSPSKHISKIAPSASSSTPPTSKSNWKSQLHPRPFTEYMALNIGIFSGFGLTSSSVGGLIAGAGLGLVFGLGAASLVAATWELFAPGSGKRAVGLALQDKDGIVAGYRERGGEGEEVEEWDKGGIEMVDLGSEREGDAEGVGELGAEDGSKAPLTDINDRLGNRF